MNKKYNRNNSRIYNRGDMYMNKEVVIKNKRMANTIRYISGEHYLEREDLKDRDNMVYVFNNRDKVLKVMTALKELRAEFHDKEEI